MLEKSVTVEIPAGLQARPAAQFVQTATRFSSDVFLEKNEKRINGKSIMGLMSLAIAAGENVRLIVSGQDQEAAMKELSSFISKSK